MSPARGRRRRASGTRPGSTGRSVPRRPGPRGGTASAKNPVQATSWWLALRDYGQSTRAIGPSLVLVVPLLLVYEGAMAWLQPPVRNSAELVVSGLTGLLPAHALLIVRLLLLGVLVAAAVPHLRRQRPPGFEPPPARWLLLESLALAVLLGPLVGHLVGGFGLSATNRPETTVASPWLPYLLSVGAGLWEEIVFRLGLLGGTVFLLARFTTWKPLANVVIAIVASSLVFSLYHHVGPGGEALVADRFAFRSLAGILLGVVFAWRGLAVVVYMHVFYDLLCDLRLALA